MPASFAATTAEMVLAAVDAVVALSDRSTAESVADFLEIPKDRAESALLIANEIGLINNSTGTPRANGMLAKLTATSDSDQKAAILRIALEDYPPFVTFRMRLRAVPTVEQAAQQTKKIHALVSHKEEVKDTLLSLGTYSGALQATKGKYTISEAPLDSPLTVLSKGCETIAAAEQRIRVLLGDELSEYASRADVVEPLADALIRTTNNDAGAAVTSAGNAFESFLIQIAATQNINIAGATGINSKIDKFRTNGQLPSKLVGACKYLGHIRNAADHGIDTDINESWTIQLLTARAYVSTAISLMIALHGHFNGSPGQI